jgi:hypothetical protein
MVPPAASVHRAHESEEGTQMNRILRLSSLILALVVAIGLVATTTAPAQAQPRSTDAPRAAEHVLAPVATDCGDERCPVDDGTVTNPGPQDLASSYCGSWWRGPMWCINFNKSEQKWLAGLSVSAAAAAICGTTGIGCIVAGSVAYALQRYVDSHGYCPSSHPILEVEYAPTPGGYAGCSNG